MSGRSFTTERHANTLHVNRHFIITMVRQKKNYYDYLCDDMVNYKKYFYVLRPILACKWIEEKKCPPPVLFDELVNTVLEEDMKAAVEDLLAKKVKCLNPKKAQGLNR